VQKNTIPPPNITADIPANIPIDLQFRSSAVKCAGDANFILIFILSFLGGEQATLSHKQSHLAGAGGRPYGAGGERD
jgi:hypothetical protein